MSAEPVAVLVVVADSHLRQMLATVLREVGYAVRVAARAQVAVHAVMQGGSQLILLDPVGLDGAALVAALRARNPVGPPVLVATVEGAGAWAERLGAQGWLSLPCELEDLLAAAERLAGPGQAARSAAAVRWPVEQDAAGSAARLHGVHAMQCRLEAQLQRIAYQAEGLRRLPDGEELEQAAAGLLRTLDEARAVFVHVDQAL